MFDTRRVSGALPVVLVAGGLFGCSSYGPRRVECTGTDMAQPAVTLRLRWGLVWHDPAVSKELWDDLPAAAPPASARAIIIPLNLCLPTRVMGTRSMDDEIFNGGTLPQLSLRTLSWWHASRLPRVMRSSRVVILVEALSLSSWRLVNCLRLGGRDDGRQSSTDA